MNQVLDLNYNKASHLFSLEINLGTP